MGFLSATTVPEAGVFTGYSTPTTARALPPGGRVNADEESYSVHFGRCLEPRALNSSPRDDERAELSTLPVFDGLTVVHKRINR